MPTRDLADTYRDYIACLNRRDWTTLGDWVHDHASHNGHEVGLAGYRAMLERDVSEIPDLRFDIELLVVNPPHVATRLHFDCTPVVTFLGLPVNGRRVQFTENVFYEFRDDKVWRVWSVVDKVAIEAQLASD